MMRINTQFRAPMLQRTLKKPQEVIFSAQNKTVRVPQSIVSRMAMWSALVASSLGGIVPVAKADSPVTQAPQVQTPQALQGPAPQAVQPATFLDAQTAKQRVQDGQSILAYLKISNEAFNNSLYQYVVNDSPMVKDSAVKLLTSYAQTLAVMTDLVDQLGPWQKQVVPTSNEHGQLLVDRAHAHEMLDNMRGKEGTLLSVAKKGTGITDEDIQAVRKDAVAMLPESQDARLFLVHHVVAANTYVEEYMQFSDLSKMIIAWAQKPEADRVPLTHSIRLGVARAGQYSGRLTATLNRMVELNGEGKDLGNNSRAQNKEYIDRLAGLEKEVGDICQGTRSRLTKAGILTEAEFDQLFTGGQASR